MDVYVGSDYWAITYECAQFVYEKMSAPGSPFMKYFKYSYVPSEMCIQTIVFNSSFQKDALLYPSDKDYSGLNSLTPLHFIDYSHQIKILKENDFQMLINSNKMFFRKAETETSDRLLSQIDKLRSSKAEN